MVILLLIGLPGRSFAEDSRTIKETPEDLKPASSFPEWIRLAIDPSWGTGLTAKLEVDVAIPEYRKGDTLGCQSSCTNSSSKINYTPEFGGKVAGSCEMRCWENPPEDWRSVSGTITFSYQSWKTRSTTPLIHGMPNREYTVAWSGQIKKHIGMGPRLDLRGFALNSWKCTERVVDYEEMKTTWAECSAPRVISAIPIDTARAVAQLTSQSRQKREEAIELFRRLPREESEQGLIAALRSTSLATSESASELMFRLAPLSENALEALAAYWAERTAANSHSDREYFPMKKGARYEYHRGPNKHVVQVVDVNDDDAHFRETFSGSSKLGKMDAEVHVRRRDEGVTVLKNISTSLGRNQKKQAVLQFPLVVGAGWRDSETTEYRVGARGITVKVPAGVFKDCVRIDAIYMGKPIDASSWYAPGVGLVKDGLLGDLVEITGIRRPGS
jgi:hypothetical protein